MSEIRTNSRGTSRLLLSYPIQLRLRAARMSTATATSQQQVIRDAIEAHVSAWEAANHEPKPKRTRRTSRTGSRPKAAKGGAK
jgi:hypothetical protein